MQIHSTTSHEIVPSENRATACPACCPLCNGSLVRLHNSYRCSRCRYYLCAGCEAIETESINDRVG